MSNLQQNSALNIKQTVRYKGGIIDQLEVVIDWTIEGEWIISEQDITKGMVIILDKVKKMFGPIPIKIGANHQPLETFLNESIHRLTE